MLQTIIILGFLSMPALADSKTAAISCKFTDPYQSNRKCFFTDGKGQKHPLTMQCTHTDSTGMSSCNVLFGPKEVQDQTFDVKTGFSQFEWAQWNKKYRLKSSCGRKAENRDKARQLAQKKNDNGKPKPVSDEIDIPQAIACYEALTQATHSERGYPKGYVPVAGSRLNQPGAFLFYGNNADFYPGQKDLNGTFTAFVHPSKKDFDPKIEATATSWLNQTSKEYLANFIKQWVRSVDQALLMTGPKLQYRYSAAEVKKALEVCEKADLKPFHDGDLSLGEAVADANQDMSCMLAHPTNSMDEEEKTPSSSFSGSKANGAH